MNKIGLYLGRFQPFHKGHLSVIQEAMKHCDHLIIAIGSAQEEATLKNPFSYTERVDMIYDCLEHYYPLDFHKFTVIGIEDRNEYSDDSSWGKYLISTVEELTGLRPHISFEGEETIRSHWFDDVDIERVVIPRELVKVSATDVRETLRLDDYAAYCDKMPKPLHSWFDGLQKQWLTIHTGHFVRKIFILETEEPQEFGEPIRLTSIITSYLAGDTLEEAVKRHTDKYPERIIISAKEKNYE